ncbi:hypothetical protein [Nonomuraea harbinensis]|uniref:SapB/AmfS family lantipeptide n=1 Tax=Nonomuraea harbinensis TaxID=1286938 RepID=A0ABW1BS60_9ACTN|nr:hypothetical protein [Nonomuraea harbinensis]
MGYVLNLQGRSAASSGDEPASIISTASATAVCAASTVSLSACLGGSTISAVVCM